jgi:excisionase family DNA binding protein
MSDVVRIVLQPGQKLEVTYAEPVRAVAREAETLDEVAARYGTTVRVLRGLVASGRLPAVKLGRSYSVRGEDAARVLAPTVKSPARTAKPANDSDEALVAKLRARGVRVGAIR